MADPNTITIAPGSVTVTGNLTQFQASEGDLFVAGGSIAVVASRITNVELRLQQPWAGPNLLGVPYVIIDIGPYLRQTFTLNRTVIDLIRRFDIAAPFKFDAYGTTEGRDAYNGQAKGFVYLAIDGVRARLFLKLQNTNSAGDWSAPIAIGTGEQVDFEDALEDEREARIADVQSVRNLVSEGQSGANGAVAALRTYVDQKDASLVQADAAILAELRQSVTGLQTVDTNNRGYLEGLISSLTANYLAGDSNLRTYLEGLIVAVQNQSIQTDGDLQTQILTAQTFFNDQDLANRAFLEGLNADRMVDIANAAKDLGSMRAAFAAKLGLTDLAFENHEGVTLGGVYYPFVVGYSDGPLMGGLTVDGQWVSFAMAAGGYSEETSLVTMPDGNKFQYLITDQDNPTALTNVLGGVTDDNRIVLYLPLEHPGQGTAVNDSGFPDISHIVDLGQSNNQGSQAMPVVSGTDTLMGNYKFTRGVATRLDFNNTGTPLLRPASDFVFVPLTAAVQEVFTGETIAVGMTANLKAHAYGGRFVARDMTKIFPHYLVSYPNRGGKHLGELDFRDWEVTLQSNPNPGVGSYFAHFIDDISRAKAQAASLGLTYGVVAFTFWQGENEGTGYRIPGVSPYEAYSVFVPNYLADLRNSYLNWNSAALQTNPAQKRDIPMFIIQVQNQWAGESQLQLAAQDARIFAATPCGFAPSALNAVYNGSDHGAAIHHAADGQRWIGEIVGKVMRKVLKEGKDWKGVVPLRLWRVSDGEVHVRFNVPVKPLVLDNTFYPKMLNQGFELIAGSMDSPGGTYTITGVSVISDDTVSITVNTGASPVVAGAQLHCRYGMVPYTSPGVVPNFTAQQAGPSRVVGTTSFPTTEFVFNGDLSSIIDSMLQEGCFIMRQYTSGAPNAVIRSKRVSGGKTYLLAENREITGTLDTVQYNSIERDSPFGNLRDSDDELSVFSFADSSYGNRAGMPYPLWNHAHIFQRYVET